MNKVSRKNSSSTQKEFNKEDLKILTDENDRLLKTLKKPRGSYKAA